MPQLTKWEMVYMIITGIVAISLMVITIWLLDTSPTNCWNEYRNAPESVAIKACENHG